MGIYLFGNTGIANRGCEAIVRSTCKLLDKKNGDIALHTYAPQQDLIMCQDMGIDMISRKYDLSIGEKIVIKLLNRIYKLNALGTKISETQLFNKMTPNDYLLNIGGDTYCYGKPYRLMRANKCFSKITNTVLWCCSVEDSAIDSDVVNDLNTYKYIFARESLTVNNLLKKGVKKEKIKKVCDPAFFLDAQKVELPKCFSQGEVIGINVSYAVIKKKNSEVYDATVGLIRYILENTNLQICLIPHVYSIQNNSCDWPLLVSLKKELNSERVDIVDSELNCMELKYIISQCRYMIAARTHASIAAYSTCVPTLVLGYSIKSKGIATDLFGESTHYVIPYQDISSDKNLIDAFVFLRDHEDEIKRRLTDILPGYKKELLNAIELYLA